MSVKRKSSDPKLERDIENLIIPLIRDSPLGVDTARPYTIIRSHYHLDTNPNKEFEKELDIALDEVIRRYMAEGKIEEKPLCADASKYVWIEK